MVCFVVPLRSKGSTKNWEKVVKDFNRTIKSIFNQKSSSEFKCIVVCNEIPELYASYDERLEFIQINNPIPREWIEMARDQLWRKMIGAIRVRELLMQMDNPQNGIYVMVVDADDMVNCKIAEWCEKNPDEYGGVSAKGYVWNGRSRFMTKYSAMHTYCGSCSIVKMFEDELPECCPASPQLCHDKETAGLLNERYPIRYDHSKVVEIYHEMGRDFAVLPFYSTIYMRETGENMSEIYRRERQRGKGKRFHPVAFLRSLNVAKYQLVSKKIKDEFGMW